MRRFVLSLALAGIVAAIAAGSALAAGDRGPGFTFRWQVTITNLAPATGPGASQPLSPPLVVVHNRQADVWERGAPASAGVAAIAEDADNSVLAGTLPGARGVRDVFTATGAPILPGASASFVVESGLFFNRLSLLTMLVNTNDAFTGLDSVQLFPFGLFGKTFYVGAYDAGSEQNTELKTHIPGPCCGNPGAGVDESGVVSHHPGIQGVGDLSAAVYGWSDPVAKITVAPYFG